MQTPLNVPENIGIPSSEQKHVWRNEAIRLTPTLNTAYFEPRALGRVGIDSAGFQQRGFIELTPYHHDHMGTFSRGETIVLDFSQHLVGHLELSVAGEARLRINPAEVPSEIADRWENYPARFENGIEPKRSWHDSIANVTHGDNLLAERMALRYIKLTVEDGNVEFKSIRFKAQSSGSFALPEPDPAWCPAVARLNQIAQVTLRNCMHEVFEDGPKRDRRLWLGDLRLQALSAYRLFDCQALVKRCLLLHASALREDGFIPPCVYLKDGIPQAGGELIPDYAMLFGPTLVDYVEHTGDLDLGGQLFEVACYQLKALAGSYRNASGVISFPKGFWCFIDWSSRLDRQASEHATAIYAASKLVILAKLLPGKQQEQAWLQELRAELKHAAGMLWDDDLGVYISGVESQVSLASQIWMVLAGVHASDERSTLLARAARHPEVVPIGTPYLVHYYLEALCLAGNFAGAARELDRVWGGMMRRGCDTFWEVFSEQNEWESPYRSHLFNSYCHAWSCTPSWFFTHPDYGIPLVDALNAHMAGSV